MISPPATGIMNNSGVSGNEDAIELNKKLLSIGQKLKMPVLLADPRISGAVTSDLPVHTLLDGVADDYRKSSALGAYFITDEPSATQFPRLGQIVSELRRQDPKHISCINLFPTYANPAQLGSSTYKQHLEEFVRVVQPELLSYDHYHWMLDTKAPQVDPNMSERDKILWEIAWERKGAGDDRPGYMENLEIAREVSRKHQLPLMVVALLLPHGPYRDPNMAELLWDAYQALAYGAKALCWFTYWTPGKDEWNFHNACIDEKGKRTHNYAEIAKVNNEILPIGRALYHRRSLGVVHVGSETEPVEPFRPNSVIEAVEGGRFALGYFTYGITLVTNKDYANTSTCRIKVAKGIRVIQFDRSTARFMSVALDDGWLSLKLRPGSGELIKMT